MRSRICILARYFPGILQLEKLTHFAPPKFSSGKYVRTPCLNYATFTQITQILRKIRKILRKIRKNLRKIRKSLRKIRKVYATSEGLTTQKFSNPFREIRIFY